MKALVKFAKGREGIALWEVPVPEPGAGELLVRVLAVGICGTDIHILQDEYAYNPPVTIGHEYTGFVEKLGEGVTGFVPGDQVISRTAAVVCGHCRYCNEGLYMLCGARKSIGSGVNGAMAEFIVIPAAIAYKVPDGIAVKESLALSEPFTCCIRAVLERSPVKAGNIAAVVGPGPIGIMTMLLLKLADAFVIVAGCKEDAARLQLAKQMGADVIANSTAALEETVRVYAPLGVDVAYECAGVAASAESCLHIIRPNGHYAQVALFGKPVPVDLDYLLIREIGFSVSFGTEPSSWDILLRLLAQNKVDLAPLCATRFPLTQWEPAFDMAIHKQGYRILLLPGE